LESKEQIPAFMFIVSLYHDMSRMISMLSWGLELARTRTY